MTEKKRVQIHDEKRQPCWWCGTRNVILGRKESRTENQMSKMAGWFRGVGRKPVSRTHSEWVNETTVIARTFGPLHYIWIILKVQRNNVKQPNKKQGKRWITSETPIEWNTISDWKECTKSKDWLDCLESSWKLSHIVKLKKKSIYCYDVIILWKKK